MAQLVRGFQDLEAWRKAHALTLAIYAVTKRFPAEERYGIVSQLRRSASSVPANIAEGYGRRSTKEFLRDLEIANGSLEETRYFLILSRDLGHLKPDEFAELNASCGEVGRLMGGLSQALRRRLH